MSGVSATPPPHEAAPELGESPPPPPVATTTFPALGLSPALCEVVARAGYTAPTEIQAKAIPEILAGHDVVGQSRTGTGKTAAFVLPILDRLVADGPVRALAIVPTRELAIQVTGEVERFGAPAGIRSATLYGGQPLKGQTSALTRGVDFAVGTPGRLLDLLHRRALMLDEIQFVVLDECDRMLDLGFRDDIDAIMRRTLASRQTLLFSATIPAEVEGLARRYLRHPTRIFIAPEKLTVDEVDQCYISVDKHRRIELLIELLRREDPPMTVVFARTRAAVKDLGPRLARAGFDAQEIHGDLDQKQRERVLAAFRAGKLRVLVATDVASRGLDIAGISHIVNYDLPDDPEDYVHRIGRTARMGRRGRAVAFVTPEQGELLTAIEKLINREVPEERFEGFEATEPRESAESKPLPKIGWRSASGRHHRRRRH